MTTLAPKPALKNDLIRMTLAEAKEGLAKKTFSSVELDSSLP